MSPTPGANDDRPARLLLSIDFEDWHQLVRRRVRAPGWQLPGPALARQTDALLALLDDMALRATFFILGMTARAHPDLVQAIAARGHEIGSHGDRHLPVHGQTRSEFGADLRAARTTIEQLTGHTPLGYRAPAFSVTTESSWAYEIMAEEGLGYDASQHDSPRIPNRVVCSSRSPHQLELAGGRTLWEFPAAVWCAGRLRIPVGGASYWALMPTAVVLHGLARAGPLAGVYLHPYELDPEPLDAALATGAPMRARVEGRLRALQRNAARRRGVDILRAVAERHRLIPYGDAYAELAGGTAARP